MSNLGGGELLLLFVLALVVLGPERLPKVAREAGRWLGELRRLSSGFQDELRAAVDFDPDDDRPSPFRDGDRPFATDEHRLQPALPAPSPDDPGDDEHPDAGDTDLDTDVRAGSADPEDGSGEQHRWAG